MMDPSKWRDEPFDLALENLRLSVLARGTCLIVVVGAGASAESGVPLGDEVSTRIRGAMPEFSMQFENEGGPQTLEGFLEFVRHRLRFNFNPTASIARLLADAGIPAVHSATAVPSLLHLLVARLAASGVAPIIVSLNFDEILERCLRAELGPPLDFDKLDRSCNQRWISLADVSQFERARQFIRFEKDGLVVGLTGRSSGFQTVLIKPHGTISQRRLLAAAEDVREFHSELKAVLLNALERDDVHLLFLGCSLRDSDFLDLFSTATEMRASMTLFGPGDFDKWREEVCQALGRHPLDCSALKDTSMVYVACERQADDPCVQRRQVAAQTWNQGTALTSDTRRVKTRTRLSPGRALLKVMVAASEATGQLQERNAPAVSDIRIHEWVRHHLVGSRQGPESFFATELLIGAAHENGVFDKDRIIKARGHLALLQGSSFESLSENLFRRFVETGVLITVQPAPRFALGKIKNPHCLRSISELVGPLRTKDLDTHRAQLVDLLIDLAENKARRSTWRTGDPIDLVGIERGTSMVLDTTDELFVISEYGTWMRRDRLNRGLDDVVKRAREHGRGVEVILAAPPPAGSQGYLEWLVSALWLNSV